MVEPWYWRLDVKWQIGNIPLITLDKKNRKPVKNSGSSVKYFIGWSLKNDMFGISETEPNSDNSQITSKSYI